MEKESRYNFQINSTHNCKTKAIFLFDLDISYPSKIKSQKANLLIQYFTSTQKWTKWRFTHSLMLLKHEMTIDVKKADVQRGWGSIHMEKRHKK